VPHGSTELFSSGGTCQTPPLSICPSTA
jgi:hypothetical protein